MSRCCINDRAVDLKGKERLGAISLPFAKRTRIVVVDLTDDHYFPVLPSVSFVIQVLSAVIIWSQLCNAL